MKTPDHQPKRRRAGFQSWTVQWLAIALALGLAPLAGHAQVYSVLHNFSGSDGSEPGGTPAISGSTLYGTTALGGSNDLGVVFRMGTDGSDYTVLRSFSGSDGANPGYGPGLTVVGSTLYGTTAYGGSGPGVVFKMNTDGSGFTVLKAFTGPDGTQPFAGVVFSVSTNGSGFRVLKDCTQDDGYNRSAGLILVNGALYGTAPEGGSEGGTCASGVGGGVVFKASLDGTGYAVLRSFGCDNGGLGPQAGLVASGTNLYGCCNGGGANGPGVVYRLSLTPASLAGALSNQTVVSGANAVFTAEATGTPWLTYQWYFNGASPVSGATNAALTLVNVQPSQAGVYTVVVANDFGAVTSAPAALNVLSVPPHLDTAPLSQTLPVNADAAFSVAASGSLSISYQWYFDTTNALAGAVDATLALTNIQLSDSGAYTVVVTNPVGMVTSPPAVLTVYGVAPAIAAPPSNQRAIVSSTCSFSVSASGSAPLAYQWFFSATNALAGATNSVLELMNVQFPQSGPYAVVVTNAFGAVTSSPALLTVFTPTVLENTDAALREALAHGGVIPFACDGTIPLTNQIVITKDTVLDGTGHQITLAPVNPGPSGGTNRAFYVSSNVTFTILNLVISNGCAQALDPLDSAGARGGAILNDGVLNLRGVSFLNNSASHGGGAVANRGGGAVYAVGGTFAGNRAGLFWPAYALPAYGGAILNEGARMSLQTCQFDGNSAQGGPDDPLNGPPSNGGAAGYGGAIYNEGILTVRDCTFQNNSADGGGGFTWSPFYGPISMGQPGTSGGPAYGGAICNFGVLGLASSSVVSNNATGGGGGSGQQGYFMGFPSYQPVSSGGGGNGGSSYGGGLFNGGTAGAVNCTFFANVVTGGNGGHGGPAWSGSYTDPTGRIWPVGGPAGPDGAGGSAVACLCSTNGGLALTNCTLAFSTAWGGGNGAQLIGGVSATGAFIVNTLFAANSPVACVSGAIVDGGHNLNSDASCPFTDPTSLSNTDPLLGPLADNGGPTLTMALLPGSPAIGAGDSASAPPTDQRGFPRPSNSPDIGAYQFNLPFILKAVQSAGGALDLSIFGSPNRACQLLASPDLVNWTAIATNSFGANGFVLFHDASGAGPTQKFYRAVMP